jgi:hypothetical protein
MLFVSQTEEGEWAMAPYNSTCTHTINKTAETVAIAQIVKLIKQNVYWMALENFFNPYPANVENMVSS